jgi:hypothetical protein
MIVYKGAEHSRKAENVVVVVEIGFACVARNCEWYRH